MNGHRANTGSQKTLDGGGFENAPSRCLRIEFVEQSHQILPTGVRYSGEVIASPRIRVSRLKIPYTKPSSRCWYRNRNCVMNKSLEVLLTSEGVRLDSRMISQNARTFAREAREWPRIEEKMLPLTSGHSRHLAGQYDGLSSRIQYLSSECPCCRTFVT
jgi:hypothetical protein